MKYTTKTTIMLSVAIALLTACNGKTENKDGEQNDTIISLVPDTALYGTVGEGTTMHVLELKTDGGKTLSLEMNTDEESDVQGGVFAGDRVTLTFTENDNGDKTITRMVNLTSLQGKWTSLDRNFKILEDGTVESTGSAETHPYTLWSMVNAQLVLNADTFSVLTLGPDSMSLENKNGIFVYKRQK